MSSVFDLFMVKIEAGYNHHDNPYHNSSHGADVAQTLNFLVTSSGILVRVFVQEWVGQWSGCSSYGGQWSGCSSYGGHVQTGTISAEHTRSQNV